MSHALQAVDDIAAGGGSAGCVLAGGLAADGICRMGRAGASVLGEKLRVRGVDGLWVADCSVMLALVSGNTNAPTMMIAGRAVRFILNAA